MSSVFDDIITSAKSLVDIASKKTDNVVELSKLKYRCVQLNSELKALYEKLGNAVYTMVKSDFNNKELMDSLIEEIDSLKEKIDDLNYQIAERKNIRICPACGWHNDKDACYCNKCGNRFDPAASDENAEETASEQPAADADDSAEETHENAGE